jgi:hypothetical protein
VKNVAADRILDPHFHIRILQQAGVTRLMEVLIERRVGTHAVRPS